MIKAYSQATRSYIYVKKWLLYTFQTQLIYKMVI